MSNEKIGIDLQPLFSQWVRDHAAEIAAMSNMTYEEIVAAADAAELSRERVRLRDICQSRGWIDPVKESDIPMVVREEMWRPIE